MLQTWSRLASHCAFVRHWTMGAEAQEGGVLAREQYSSGRQSMFAEHGAEDPMDGNIA